MISDAEIEQQKLYDPNHGDFITVEPLPSKTGDDFGGHSIVRVAYLQDERQPSLGLNVAELFRTCPNKLPFIL